jgi:hypothetical protein
MRYAALHDISVQIRETRCTRMAKLRSRNVAMQEVRDIRPIMSLEFPACANVEPWMGGVPPTSSQAAPSALCLTVSTQTLCDRFDGTDNVVARR